MRAGRALALVLTLPVVHAVSLAAAAQDSPSTTAVEGTPTACELSPLAPVDESVIEFENSTDRPPTPSLENIDKPLKTALQQLMADMEKRNVRVVQTSGHRPPLYQKHLHSIGRKWAALEKLFERDDKQPKGQRKACAAINADVEREIRKHRLTRLPEDKFDKGVLVLRKGHPLVNPSGVSLHEKSPALAVDLAAVPPSKEFVPQARHAGFVQPCSKDTVHFTAPSTKCEFTFEAGVRSPVRLLITDPLRRRIGFDAATQQSINEIGPGADYSNRIDDLEVISIAGALPGVYTIDGIGTDAGSYEMSVAVFNEAGSFHYVNAWRGMAAAGERLPRRRVEPIRLGARRQEPARAGLAAPPPDLPPPAADTAANTDAGRGGDPPAAPPPSVPRKDSNDTNPPWPISVRVAIGALIASGIVVYLSRRRPGP